MNAINSLNTVATFPALAIPQLDETSTFSGAAAPPIHFRQATAVHFGNVVPFDIHTDQPAMESATIHPTMVRDVGSELDVIA